MRNQETYHTHTGGVHVPETGLELGAGVAHLDDPVDALDVEGRQLGLHRAHVCPVQGARQTQGIVEEDLFIIGGVGGDTWQLVRVAWTQGAEAACPLANSSAGAGKTWNCPKTLTITE